MSTRSRRDLPQPDYAAHSRRSSSRAAAAADAMPYTPVAGGKALRQRAPKSYADLSAHQIVAESRQVERLADSRDRLRRNQLEDDDDDDDEVEVYEGVAAEASRELDGDEDDGEYEYDAEAAEDEAAAEAVDDDDEEDEAEEPLDRRHLSRSAKTTGLDRVSRSVRPSQVRAAPKVTLVDLIIAGIVDLDLNRVKGGFTIQKVRLHLQRADPALTTPRFNKGWYQAVSESILYNPGDDANRWKMDRTMVEARHDAREHATTRRATNHGSSSKHTQKPHSRNVSDDDDDDVIMLQSAAASKAPIFVDPAVALFKHLRDALSPWRDQIEASEARAQQHGASAHTTDDAAELSAHPAAERRSRRQSGLTPDATMSEHKQAENPDAIPVSSLSSLTVKPIRSSGGECEHKEEKKSPPPPSPKEEEDVLMVDAADHPSDAIVADDESVSRYLSHKGQSILLHFALFSVLRAPNHKLTLTQLRDALQRLPHLPAAFFRWAISPATSGVAASSESAVDDHKEPLNAPRVPSPLETALAQLVSLGHLQQNHAARRLEEYRATTLALDSARTAAPSVQLRVPKRGGRGSSQAQMAHAAEMRALKLQMSLTQTAFIERHLAVFAPFITNPKVRAIYRLPATLPTRTAEDVVPTTTVEFAHYPVPAIISSPDLVRDYQIRGFSFLAHLHDQGASAILADEMGLGKTLQTISFLAWLKENRSISGPHLVVVPLNVLDTWIGEVHRWCPTMRAVRFHGSEKERKRIYQERLQHGTFDIMVTTYETVVVAESFLRHHFYFGYVIVDEAHRIKNELSLLSIALRHVSCLNRVLLTGTPLQNNLHELWALLNFLYPHLFPASEPFDKGFDLNSTKRIINPNVLLAAQALLKPIMIRRLKREVATKLPIKTETQIKCRLAPAQTHWYKMLLASHSGLLDKLTAEAAASPQEALVEEREDADLAEGDAQVLHETAQLDAQGNIQDQQVAHIHHDEAVSLPTPRADAEDINFGLGESMNVTASAGNDWRKLMNLMMQLRKCCNHPYILPHAESEDASRDSLITTSGKMQMLDKLLKKLHAGKHRVLIFSGFLGMLNILGRFCEMRRYKFLRLDGSTNRAQRKFDVHRFNQSNEFFIYLLSPRAGGIGINLTGADTVIHYDSDWNPAIDLQAQDRAHRIGQARPVRVFRLLMDQTVEERIIARAQRKLYLDTMITSGQAGLQSMESDALSKAELLSMLKFGSDSVFQSTGAIEDRDIDAILAGSTTNLMDDAAIERDAPTVLANTKLNCADFDVSIGSLASQALITDFDGHSFKAQSFRSIADSWVNLERSRVRQGTTVKIGQDAVLRSNNYSWESTLGRELEERDIRHYNVQYKRWIDNEVWCGVCHDGGELYLCSGCPRAYHAECLEYRLEDYMIGSTFRCPQHACSVCERRASDAGGMLFKCAGCPLTWCEEHAPHDLIPIRNDPALVKLGYTDRPNAFYVLCGAKDCTEYFDEWVRPLDPHHTAADADGEEQVDENYTPLNQLLAVDAGSGEESKEAEPAAAPVRKSSRAAAAAAAKSAPPVVTEYSKLSDRLRGRLKKVLAREADAAAAGVRQSALGEIHSIAHVFEYMHGASTMLHAIHHMLFGEEANSHHQAKSRVMEWTGLPHDANKLEAGDFFARCADELRGWHTKSVQELSKVLHLTTHTPPKVIESGPNKGKMSHTEPRSFTIDAGSLDEQTGLRGDPLEVVTEHIIIFLMAPRPAAMPLKFEYINKSILKDNQWREELRIEQETGVPRVVKTRKKKVKQAKPAKPAKTSDDDDDAPLATLKKEKPSASPSKHAKSSKSSKSTATSVSSAIGSRASPAVLGDTPEPPQAKSETKDESKPSKKKKRARSSSPSRQTDTKKMKKKKPKSVPSPAKIAIPGATPAVVKPVAVQPLISMQFFMQPAVDRASAAAAAASTAPAQSTSASRSQKTLKTEVEVIEID